MSLETVFSFSTMAAFAIGYTVAYRGLVHGAGRVLKSLERAHQRTAER